MSKFLVLAVMLPVTGIAAAAGYITRENIQAYAAESQRSIQQLNQSLQSQNLEIKAETLDSSLFGIFRDERYTLRELEQGMEIFAIRQQVTIEPLRAYGQFGFDPSIGLAAVLFQAAPQLIEQQQGKWSFDPYAQQITTHYQTGAVDMSMPDGMEIHLLPLVFNGLADTTGKRKGNSSLEIPRISFKHPVEGNFALRGLQGVIRSHISGGDVFIDHANYKIGNIVADSYAFDFSLKDFEVAQTSLVDQGVLSSLLSVSFDDLKANSANKNISLDSSNIRMFFDGIDWRAINSATQKLETFAGQSQYGSPRALPPELLKSVAGIAAMGATITLETLESSFVLLDRGPENMAISGDVAASGLFRLLPGEADTLSENWYQRLEAAMQVDASRSLMQSPFAEYMVEFIDAGFIREDGDRLISQLRFGNGALTANGLSLDVLAQAD